IRTSGYAIVTVSLIQLTRWLLVALPDFAAGGKKLTQPITCRPVLLHRLEYAIRRGNSVSGLNESLGPFNNPGQHSTAGSFKQEVGVILDIVVSRYDGVEGYNHESSPGAFVRRTHLRQMVRVQNDSVRRDEVEWLLVLLFCPNRINGAQALNCGRIKALAFL